MDPMGAGAARGGEPKLLRVPQIRERLAAAWGVPVSSVGADRVKGWIKRGELYHIMLDRAYHVPASDVDRFAREFIQAPDRTERQAS